jgi:hypothetical protein
MSRFTDPMILAREPGADDGEARPGRGDFWSRMEALGVKVTRAKSTDPAEGVKASQAGLEQG